MEERSRALDVAWLLIDHVPKLENLWFYDRRLDDHYSMVIEDTVNEISYGTRNGCLRDWDEIYDLESDED